MKKLIKRHKPTIVALLETRVLASHAAGIVGRLGFAKSIVIDPEGFSGGMCLLWDPEEVDIQATKESRWVIHAVVTAKFKRPWILSSIYGSTNKVTRKRIWDELEAIAEFGQTGHMVMGDLNTIGARNEKPDGKEPSANQLQELKDVMDQCGLIDLGANGPKFTWNNKRPGLANIKERLDHVLANEEWCKSFKNAQESVGVLEMMLVFLWQDLQNTFTRMEAMWLKYGLLEMVLLAMQLGIRKLEVDCDSSYTIQLYRGEVAPLGISEGSSKTLLI